MEADGDEASEEDVAGSETGEAVMRRKEINAIARSQKTDTRCFDTRRGKGKRAKSYGAKQLRQHFQKEDKQQ